MEILAPSGNKEKLLWALRYGADAVYIGGDNYSLRANADNFSIKDIKEVVAYAHSLKKRVYVTINMLFHNEDLKELDNYLKELSKAKVDALIVSDLGVIEAIKRLKLDIEFHISTQESITNYETAKFYEELGATRIVLARECSKEDIKQIKQKTNLELEVFVHGAMCTSYSGRCTLSNYITNRDSNRGGCAQICRYTFDIGQKEEFTFSTKDLNMIEYIKELYDLGIDSLKIEGRMRSLYYISTVINSYKTIVNLIDKNKLKKEDIEYFKKILNRCANRESASQFFNKEVGVKEQYFTGRKELTNKDFLGIVLNYNEKTKEATIEQRNYFELGDTIEVFSPTKKCFSFKVETIKNENGEMISSGRHPQEILKLKINKKVEKYDILRVKSGNLDKDQKI